MNRVTVAASLLLAAGLASAARGQVIITEILANSAGADVPGEWCEIYNAGSSPVDISGWALADEDAGSSPSDPFPDGFIIEPGEAVVIINSGFNPNNAATPVITEEDFKAAWGETNAAGDPYRVIVLQRCVTLANSGSPTNEILTLIDSFGTVIDEANYENGTNEWPPTLSGFSVTLGANFLDEFSNDFGCAWSLAAPGIDGVVVSVERLVVNALGDTVVGFSAESNGSPGYVAADSTFNDCNNNGFDDSLDICNGFSFDCNGNGIPDECEPDCDGNGQPDSCDIAADYLLDANLNGVLDSCEIDADPSLDLNNNGALDAWESIRGDAIISEIMYDPATSAEMEYVEVYNTTGAPLDISGWYLRDIEPAGDPATDPVPSGTILPAGGIAVLTRSVTGDVNETRQTYIDAWGSTTPSGDPILWIPLENWGARATNGFANAEILTLASSDNYIVDIANYINQTSNGEPLPGGWPGADGHGSYYLIGTALNDSANDDGNNWRLSIEGLSGVIRSNEFDTANPPSWVTAESSGEDYGTPGYIYAGAPEQPTGTVIITEIMATSNSVFPGQDPLDPEADGGVDEWVEIYNTTGSAIDLTGWYLQDEDGRTTGFPAGSVLEAGEVAVVFGNDFPADTGNAAQAFYDAWGCGYKVFLTSNWYVDGPANFGLGRLANSPNFTNEILRIVDASGKPTDIANYDDDAFVWPVDSSGVPADDAWSIYILPGNYNAVSNDDGFVWADSLAPIDGARVPTPTSVFNGLGFAYGSPGHLQGVQVPNLTDCPDLPCSAADLAAPFGTLNIFDIQAYIGLYNAQSPAADLAAPFGTLNIFDIQAYIGLYNQGCP